MDIPVGAPVCPNRTRATCLQCSSVCLLFKTISLQRLPFLQYCGISVSLCLIWQVQPTSELSWFGRLDVNMLSLNPSLLFLLLAQLPFMHDLLCSRCEVTICRPTWRMQPLESILPHTHFAWNVDSTLQLAF